MPILKVSDAKSVVVLKRGRGSGFSGVENDLFVEEKTSMLFGDAKQSLLNLALEVKNA
jgi:NAD(P) transhydrogenase subunit beta